MKNNEYSDDLLKRIRESLPQGAQTKIAEKLSKPGKPVTIGDVSKVLNGKRIRYNKCDPAAVIMEAVSICKKLNVSQQKAKDAIESMTDNSKNQ